jgi:hypothetical protein
MDQIDLGGRGNFVTRWWDGLAPARRDMLVKAFWTFVAAVMGVGVEVVTDLPDWWAPVLISVITPILVKIRQRATGDVPPAAEDRPSAAVSPAT